VPLSGTDFRATHRQNGRPAGSFPGGRPFKSDSAVARESSAFYGTVKATLLESAALGVTTSTVPLVAPVGTVVVIKYLDTTVNVAAMPSNVTLVAPVRLLPKILTAEPTAPDVGSGFTNAPRPRDRL
jgi:hypothetical protein